MKGDPLLLDRKVCFPLYAATNLISRLYRPVLDKLGLTYPQYLVMLAL
jgi:MarR family transcriptional regulator, organic hydroperoxide resistance regulator